MTPLVQDAISNVWSMPDPYNQVIFKPARISQAGGNRGFALVGWTSLSLPNSTAVWHLFQIGNLHPILINLFPSTQGTWELVSDCCNLMSSVVDIYNGMGIQMPKCRTYYNWMNDNNLVFAVEHNPKIGVNYDADDFFIRIYQNTYFFSNSPTKGILKTNGKLIGVTADILSIQNEANTILSNTNLGAINYFVNGIKRPSIDVNTTKVGDVAEYVYDASIYRVVDWQVTSLQSFHSTKDNKNKWLLHYDAGPITTIDYCADIDIYLYDNSTGRGVYVHKNAVDTFRQLTPKDYSLAVNYIEGYYSNFTNPTTGTVDPGNLFIRIHVRYNGHQATPGEDVNKVSYLLKLPGDKQVAAMVGVNSSNTVWRAANLEDSVYNNLLGIDRSLITNDLVQSAYGYSGCNAALGKNVVGTYQEFGSTIAPVSIAFQNGAYAYEYGNDGRISGWKFFSGVSKYVCTDPATNQVEFIQGDASVALDEYYGVTTLVRRTDCNYRFYAKPVGTPTKPMINGYVDATGDSNYYAIDSNNHLTWANASNPGFVRSDRSHLTYNAVLNPTDGVLTHTISSRFKNIDNTPMAVPMGEYDFWLNGYPLIEGIDYLMSFPNITIVSTKYINRVAANTLTVRGFGLCNADFSMQRRAEKGFVFDGLLSANNRFGLFDYKPLRVVCGGKLLTNSLQAFVESTQSGSLINGTPYEIRELTNPLNGLLTIDPYLFRQQDEIIENAVSAYMTLKAPQQTPSAINPITAKYQLYSPFICKIIYAVRTGGIPANAYTGNYPDSQVQTAVVAYTYLLNMDPILDANTPDLTYCAILPHWFDTIITLTADQYRFVNNVVRIYSRGKVNISSNLAIA